MGVVNLLQAMNKKIGAEGDRADELHKKFMCYCESSEGDLQASITAAQTKIPELESSIKASTSQKVQLESDLKQHQVDRAAAKKAMAEATSLREKEKATYDKALADNQANLAATKKATVAIEQGMGGSFLQTGAADLLRNLVSSKQNMMNADRQELLSFLSGEQGGQYAPASGEIVGILKQLADEMAGDQKDMINTEESAVQNYEALMAAKKKEVATLQKALEVKMARVGNLGVDIATMKNDLEDTGEALSEDQAFTADLKNNCAERTGIHEKEQKVRSQEIVAIADTISILNSDDALELFKKTLPSAGSSLLQVQNSKALRAQAGRFLKPGHARMDFILLALRGNKVGFGKIVKLISNTGITALVQDDDYHKKEYCSTQFDQADDKKKGLERSISDLESVIEESKGGIATFSDEINALKTSISELDKQVADATEQRKAESVEFKDLMKSNTAAKEAPGGISNTGITALLQVSRRRDAPAPPPATAAAYKKKSGDGGGVIAMMDLLVKDLDEEMTVAETEEKNAQAAYEQTIADAADKRRQDSKSLTDKEASKADSEGALEQSTGEKKDTSRSLMGTERFIADLHAECDWLVKYHQVRKDARADEIDSLGKARAVLNGAGYSFLQRAPVGQHLRGA